MGGKRLFRGRSGGLCYLSFCTLSHLFAPSCSVGRSSRHFESSQSSAGNAMTDEFEETFNGLTQAREKPRNTGEVPRQAHSAMGYTT